MSGKLCFKNEGLIMSFPTKQKLREFNTCLVRNSKRMLSSWNEKMLNSNTKAYKNIMLSGKGKYIAKCRIL